MIGATNWLLRITDWEADDVGPRLCRREFDFLVDVAGDLSSPRLEEPMQVEFRWPAAHDLAVLDENRGRNDHLIRDVVSLALGLGNGQ